MGGVSEGASEARGRAIFAGGLTWRVSHAVGAGSV
jgi:hypothetical protein